MKISRKQLRKLIMETVVDFPTQDALKKRLSSLYNQLVSMYDEGDPSMAELGLAAWLEQVRNAVNFVKNGVGDELVIFDYVAEEAYNMLIDGRFHPDHMWFVDQVPDHDV